MRVGSLVLRCLWMGGSLRGEIWRFFVGGEKVRGKGKLGGGRRKDEGKGEIGKWEYVSGN